VALFFGASNIQALAEALSDVDPRHGPLTFVRMQSGPGAPLFLMPSVTGLPLPRHNLLKSVDMNRPVFAVGLANPIPPWSEEATLPEIARFFADALRSTAFDVRPHILGYSFGGMLAYEVARQLQESRLPVDKLLIIDTGPAQLRGNSLWTSLSNLARFLANVPPWLVNFAFNTSASQKIYEIRRKLRAWRRRVAATMAGNPTPRHLDDAIDTRRVPEVFRKCMETNFRAFKSYLPGPYTGRLLLLRAKIRPLIGEFTRDLKWGQLVSGGVEVIEVPGNHGSILESPNVEILASKVKAVLDAND
jgi:thioesterase domain-containing protein